MRARSRYDPVPFDTAQAVVWDEFFASHKSDLIVDLGVEARFWMAYWERSLHLLGVDESYLSEALDKFMFYKFLALYPEVNDVLATLAGHGFALGVISDTFPSLNDSLAFLDIKHFFRAVVDSATVGEMKPSPTIYQKGLKLLEVRAEESLFIDDGLENAQGARAMGMQALWLDRRLPTHRLDEGVVADLSGVLVYLGLG